MNESEAFQFMYDTTLAYWSGKLSDEQINMCEKLPDWDWKYALVSTDDDNEYKEFIKRCDDEGIKQIVKLYLSDMGMEWNGVTYIKD